MQDNQSGINDDELNKMIANLQQEQRGSSLPDGPNRQTVIQPPAQPSAPPTQPASPVAAPSLVTNASTDVSSSVPAPTSPADNQSTADSSKPLINGELADIKRQAITELRPLVDKLELSPEDKFDTLLLLIRTTDDSSLLPAAHQAASSITNDSRRAQALLDVIKEIDFFGQKTK